MPTFTESQIIAWATPVLWPFLRVLGLFSTAPIFAQRALPGRVKLLLALLIAIAAQAALPPAPALALDTLPALAMVVQQVVIGLVIGFSARIVFAGIEYGGELIGLQMGLNYATFFDPNTNGPSAATTRFFSTMVALLFVVINGHLLLTAAVIHSFDVFPVAPDPLAFFRTVQPHVWGTELFQLGVWIALPIVSMILLVNLMLGVISRVASQMQIFAIGFPITLGLGLIGITLMLPALQAPFVAALERMLTLFR